MKTLGFAFYLLGFQIVTGVGLMPWMGIKAVYGGLQLAIYLIAVLMLIAGYVLSAFWPLHRQGDV